ncbi:MAG: helix-turn-helix domain-containing protein [Hyphomicrobiales bacterium]|nr:helix-turn-helix domain-containing protein [Hyphomicrobiales bacterium]
MTLDDIATAVREARKELRLTQEQLAALAQVSRPTIARLETGRLAQIGYKPLLRILNATGLDLRLTPLNRGRPTLDELAREEEP